MSARTIPPVAPAATPPVHIPKHEAFSWLHRDLAHDEHAQFLALTLDICGGAALCLQIVQAGDLDECHEPGSAYFNMNERGQLLALAIGSLHLLKTQAAADIESVYEAAQHAAASKERA